MLEFTKRQTTDEFAEIHLHGVPSQKAELVKEAIEKILGLAGTPARSAEEDENELYSIEEVFPISMRVMPYVASIPGKD